MATRRYVACIRCIATDPDDRPPLLAVLESTDGVLLLLHATGPHVEDDPRRFVSHPDATFVEDKGGLRPACPSYSTATFEPLSRDPSEGVELFCPRCGMGIGPISAKQVAKLFREGKGQHDVLLLPRPPSGVAEPLLQKWW